MNQMGDSLSPEKMQLFLASLSGLQPEEIQKAKSLYLRNGISEYQALCSSQSSMGCLFAGFCLIPLFWPFIYSFVRTNRAARQLARDRILNALEVWKNDLGDEIYQIDKQVRDLGDR